MLIHLRAHAQIHIIDIFAFKSLQPFQDNMNILLPSVYHNFTEFFSVVQRRRKKLKAILVQSIFKIFWQSNFLHLSETFWTLELY